MRPNAGGVNSQPLNEILNWLEDDDSDDIGLISLKKKYWRNLRAMSVDGEQAVWLHVVSEILYMQGMDVKLTGDLNLDLPENVEATVTSDSPAVEEVPENSTTENNENSSQDETKVVVEITSNEQEQETDNMNDPEDNVITVTQETNAFSRALAINQILEAQGLDDNFGVRTKLIFIDDDGVVLRSTLPKPVAIGVRGLKLEVNPRTGEVLQIEAWQP